MPNKSGFLRTSRKSYLCFMERKIHPDFVLTHHGVQRTEDELVSVFPEVASFLEDWRSSNDEIVLYTSGSTGSPKQLSVSKDVMWHSAGATIAALDLKEGIRALNPLSSAFIAGKMMIVRAMRGGWSLELRKPSASVLEEIDEVFDFAAFAPLQVMGRVEHLNKIGCTILGGAPVDESLISELSAVQNRVYETYGMTETVSHIALKRIRPVADPFFEALPSVLFSKSPSDTLVIHAEEWGHPNLTTNDIVDLMDENRFTWLGRADFVINSGGVKLHPEKIEPVLRAVLKDEVYVKGVEDSKWGQRLVAVLREGKAQPVKEALLAQGLSEFEIPKEWVYVEAFPYTPSGKIDRKRL